MKTAATFDNMFLRCWSVHFHTFMMLQWPWPWPSQTNFTCFPRRYLNRPKSELSTSKL